MHSATVAPWPKACLQPLSCSTARTLRMKIRASDSSQPCIIQSQHSLHVPQVLTTRTSFLLMQIKAFCVVTNSTPVYKKKKKRKKLKPLKHTGRRKYKQTKKGTQHAWCVVLAPPSQQNINWKFGKQSLKIYKHIRENQGIRYQWAASDHVNKGSMGSSSSSNQEV